MRYQNAFIKAPELMGATKMAIVFAEMEHGCLNLSVEVFESKGKVVIYLLDEFNNIIDEDCIKSNGLTFDKLLLDVDEVVRGFVQLKKQKVSVWGLIPSNQHLNPYV